MAWVYLVAAVAACTTLAASAPVAQPPQLELNVTSQARSLGGMEGVTQFVMLSMDDALHETNGVLTERVRPQPARAPPPNPPTLVSRAAIDSPPRPDRRAYRGFGHFDSVQYAAKRSGLAPPRPPTLALADDPRRAHPRGAVHVHLA